MYPFLYNDLRLSACRSADKERGTSPLKAVRSIVPMTGEHEKLRRNINEEKRPVYIYIRKMGKKIYVSQRIRQTFTPFYFLWDQLRLARLLHYCSSNGKLRQ
jgi:hypothetical protein